MIAVVTAKGHLVIYHIVVPTDVKTLYEQIDPPSKNLKRESDELFMRELIPPLIFSLVRRCLNALKFCLFNFFLK